jgi:hypothetical protein
MHTSHLITTDRMHLRMEIEMLLHFPDCNAIQYTARQFPCLSQRAASQMAAAPAALPLAQDSVGCHNPRCDCWGCTLAACAIAPSTAATLCTHVRLSVRLGLRAVMRLHAQHTATAASACARQPCGQAVQPTAARLTDHGTSWRLWRQWPHGTSRAASLKMHGTWPGSTNNYMNGHPVWNKSPSPSPAPLEGLPGATPRPEKAGAAASPSAPNGGALTKADFPKFVGFFRQASPYIAGHRAKTFVIVVPGDVSALAAHVLAAWEQQTPPRRST